MEYVIFKGKRDILYTLNYNEDGTPWLDAFGSELGLSSGEMELPSDPCDLELFRDILHSVLTEVITKKRAALKKEKVDGTCS
jgi:hypothetical protein